MPVFHSGNTPGDLVGRWTGCALAIGNFDGVHRGHQAIIDRLAHEARLRGAGTCVLTFEPHPVQYFKPDHPAFRLTGPLQKYGLLRAYGVQEPVFWPFDDHLSRMEPEEFVNDLLMRVFSPVVIAVGADFNYGRGRRGDVELLARLCQAWGTQVKEVLPFTLDGQVVSSSRIRRAVREGEVSLARRMLGRPFTLVGRVGTGDQRGRSLGFPTANIQPETDLMPLDGVYAGYLEIGEHLWQAATNIGHRPTVGGTRLTVESFILDPDLPAGIDLYERQVALHVVERLRPEQRFPTLEALAAQIREDVAQCRVLLRGHAGEDILRGVSFVESPGFGGQQT